MRVRLAKESDKLAWDQYVETFLVAGNAANGGDFSGASFFYLWGYRQILEKIFGFEPLYLIIENELSIGGKSKNKGIKPGNQDVKPKIVGVMPLFIRGKISGKKLVTAPFADYTGPLIDEGVNSEIIFPFIQDLLREKHIDDYDFFSLQKAFADKSANFNSDKFCTFILSTNTSFEKILKTKIHQKTRNMINKAKKNDLHVQLDENFVDLRKYYDLYLKTMFRLKSLPLPFLLFRNMANEMSDKVKLFTVKKNEEVVAGILALAFNETLFIWSNASDHKFSNIGANNEVYAGTIKYACDSTKIKYVDFGSTMTNTSHHFFKKRWGGREMPIYRITKNPTVSGEENGSKFLNGIISFISLLPNSIAQRIFVFIFRNY
ncbi:GNAT family N-acetyltransferase [Patescibacteria group bacterium]|nr:GNAT family N-acetyltransferase [Patescibacteria group bacterium]